LKSDSEVGKTIYDTVNKKQTRIGVSYRAVENSRSAKTFADMVVATSNEGFLPVHAPATSSYSLSSPLSPSISPSLFHSRLKT